jgi:predicted GIY-YIG superfamily endonuclease
MTFLYGIEIVGRGVVYIGVAVKPRRRFGEHKRGCGTRPNPALTEALQRSDSILLVLAHGREDRVYALEPLAIEALGTRAFGYNRAKGHRHGHGEPARMSA